MTIGDLVVETVPIERLHGNPSNPRHNDDAVPHVAASLQRFGWQQPLVARRSGEVVAGNTRLKAAVSLEMTEVPVVWFDGPDIEAVAFAIADNRTSEFATWDEPALAALLKELQAEDALEGSGYDDSALDELIAGLEEDLRDQELEDPGPEAPPEVPRTTPGTLYLLGEHRLLCGDSTRREDVERLMDGEQAAWMWTDPPYGVSYQGKTAEGLTIQNDGAEGLADLLQGAFTCADPVLAAGAPIYVAHPAGPASIVFGQAFAATGWKLHQTLVWVKNSLVLGHSDYHYRHEPILYGWKGKNRPWHGGRSQDTVFDVDRPSRSEDHPTMKPVELIASALRNSSRPGDIGYEPFGGSGSTLIAAEQLGRRCFAMELDPRYCDVIVRRWEAATGRQAEVVSP